MRLMSIKICEQTHPRCQGFAADDHIDTKCFTVRATPKFEAKVEPILAKIDAKYKENLDEVYREWRVLHPGEECGCEGDEFVGLVWVEHFYFEGSGGDFTSRAVVLDELVGVLERMG